MANDFGVRTFVQLDSVKKGENSVFSPASLGIACALVAEGCQGDCREQVVKVLAPHSRYHVQKIRL